jgi:signal transduction histidine kinase
MARTSRWAFWKYARGLVPPLLLWALCVGYLVYLYNSRYAGEEMSDEAALREWLQEARITSALPALIREYLASVRRGERDVDHSWRDQFQTYLTALGEPLKKYQGQLPFFPVVYRIELEFPEHDPDFPRRIVWDSDVPRHPSQYRSLRDFHLQDNVRAHVDYQLHAYNTRRRDEREAAARVRWVAGLTAAATALAFLWIYLLQRRERERAQQRTQAQQQINQAERLLLMEELRRQESDQKLLELKSQLFANIGIMAGSYAHNIKNLLVRPNDLLRRCLERDSLSGDQQQMLHEVRLTLATVTERLQQILQTVRRDPSRAELTRIDLNAVAAELQRTWEHLAREKWKLTLRVDLWPEPLVVEGDLSHLQQAAENLLFNARDATFEMRNHLRERARRGPENGDGREALDERRQALIAAAAWKGSVVLRTRRDGDRGVLEIEDNGIGMTEEVRRRCTETHFSTKRNNAIYEGYNAGMGLGLSFVTVVLQHQAATLDIESAPLGGTTFRVQFPLLQPVAH